MQRLLNGTDFNGKFGEGDPQTGQNGSIVSANIANAWTEELAGLVENTGEDLNPANDLQVFEAVRGLVRAGNILPGASFNVKAPFGPSKTTAKNALINPFWSFSNDSTTPENITFFNAGGGVLEITGTLNLGETIILKNVISAYYFQILKNTTSGTNPDLNVNYQDYSFTVGVHCSVSQSSAPVNVEILNLNSDNAAANIKAENKPELQPGETGKAWQIFRPETAKDYDNFTIKLTSPAGGAFRVVLSSAYIVPGQISAPWQAIPANQALDLFLIDKLCFSRTIRAFTNYSGNEGVSTPTGFHFLNVQFPPSLYVISDAKLTRSLLNLHGFAPTSGALDFGTNLAPGYLPTIDLVGLNDNTAIFKIKKSVALGTSPDETKGVYVDLNISFIGPTPI